MSVQDVYNAIHNDDLAGCVLAQLNVMRCGGLIEPLNKNVKNANISDAYRSNGNVAFRSGNYKQALLLYNQALAYAPKGSNSMLLAYSNRSALWLKVSCYVGCVQDIDKCFVMGCPPDLRTKLTNRVMETMQGCVAEKLSMNASTPAYFNEFFKLKSLNTDIPNASQDIKIIVEPDGPKIVAARDINVGTVLAMETPFVGCITAQNNYVTCHYCYKMPCNLIPCDGCCVALFCDEHCMQMSMNEDHGVLCPIIDILTKTDFHCVLAIKAIIKIRQNSKSWKEFMSVADKIGASEPSNYINDIFVEKLLWFKADDEKRYFVPGKMFVLGQHIANIVHHLDVNTDFFPINEAKLDAIHTVSKLLMNISLYAWISIFSIPVSNKTTGTVSYNFNTNFVLYRFISTLKHSCMPNVKAESSGGDVALISMGPIKEGAELTISHIGHWLEEHFKRHGRSRRMFFLFNKLCTCIMCSGEGLTRTQLLNDAQIQIYKKYCTTVNQMEPIRPHNLGAIYKESCKALQELNDFPYSAEYRSVFTQLTRCFLTITDSKNRNVTL